MTFKNILNAIDTAEEMGYTSISIDLMDHEVKEKLQRYGFSVRFERSRDDEDLAYYTISW